MPNTEFFPERPDAQPIIYAYCEPNNPQLKGMLKVGYTSRTIEAMTFSRSRNAQVIGITDGPMSPLHKEADICLSARTDMTSFVDSLVAPLSVINALLVALALKKRADLNAHLEKLEGIWDAYSVYINKENQ